VTWCWSCLYARNIISVSAGKQNKKTHHPSGMETSQVLASPRAGNKTRRCYLSSSSPACYSQLLRGWRTSQLGFEGLSRLLFQPKGRISVVAYVCWVGLGFFHICSLTTNPTFTYYPHEGCSKELKTETELTFAVRQLQSGEMGVTAWVSLVATRSFPPCLYLAQASCKNKKIMPEVPRAGL